MRFLLTVATSTALALAACSGESVDESATDAEPAAGEPREATVEAGLVRLRGDGIMVTGPAGTDLAFNSPRYDVERELTRVLGPVKERSTNDECGAGPMEFSRYEGGLTANFQDEKLVGWYFDGDAGSKIATDKGITIGSPEGELVAAHTIQMQDESTLGDEFYSESGIGGFLTGDGDAQTVEALYAGTTCFFR